MRTVSVINLKGGVGKTLSSVNMAHILAAVHGQRVLLVDNDKQGNASRMLGRHSYGKPGMAEILTDPGVDMEELVRHTDYEGLDIVTANMNLLSACLAVLMDRKRPRETRLRKALEQVEERYDFCIIDNAPDINISTVNALVASDDVLVPVTIDEFALDGLAELKEQIDNTRRELNPALRFCGCFITRYDRLNEADRQGQEYLETLAEYPLFHTCIRRTVKMKQSTFAREPILLYSSRCGASRDYKELVEEYLGMCPGRTRKGEDRK